MIFDKFLKRKVTTAAALYPVEFPAGRSAFTPWSGDAYQNDIYRSALDAVCRNVAKLKPSHVIQNGEVRHEGPCRLNRILQNEPNPYMSSYDFLYKLTAHLFLYGNSFALINRDASGTVSEIYPLNVSRVEFLGDQDGGLFLKCGFRNGKQYVFPYGDVIHLRRHFNSDDLLGDPPDALSPALELAHTLDEGVVNSVQAGAHIRGLLQIEQIMSPELLRETKDQFVQDFLSVNNYGGIVATDKKGTFTPLNNNPTPIDPDELQFVKQKIFNSLGVSQEIVDGSYNEDQWAAFYESTLEPLALQMSLEFSRKIFSRRELSFGNQILFECNRLQFASSQTKTTLLTNLLPMGVLTINEAREVLNLPSVEDGDRRLQTLNVIDQANANKYQLGEGVSDGK